MDRVSRLDRWCAEPFQVFFPLGLLASIIGVLLWPASSAGWLHTYPLEGGSSRQTAKIPIARENGAPRDLKHPHHSQEYQKDDSLPRLDQTCSLSNP